MNAITLTPAHEMPAEELALAVRNHQIAQLPAAVRAAYEIGEAEIIKRGDALLTEASKITEVADKAGRAQAHAVGQALVKLRTEIERKAKAMRDDSNAYSKECIAAEKRLVARTKPAEDTIILLRDQFDAAEKARKAAHESALQAIRARAILPSSMPSSELQATIGAVQAELSGREWEEYSKAAKTAADEVCLCLETTVAAAKAREAAEAQAREEAARIEAERLAREAEEQAAREAAEREAARKAKHASALVDLELGIARQIRDARSGAAAQAVSDVLTGRWEDYHATEAARWEEFADEAALIIKQGHYLAADHAQRLKAAEAQAEQARIERAAREAAEREAAEARAAVARAEAEAQAKREAEAKAAREAEATSKSKAMTEDELAAHRADIAAAAKASPGEMVVSAVVPGLACYVAPQLAPMLEPVITPDAAPVAGIRWGELCAVLGHEIPPWVLASLGCESEAGIYSRESLAGLRAGLESMTARLSLHLNK